MGKIKNLLVTAKYGSLEYSEKAKPYIPSAEEDQARSCAESITQQIIELIGEVEAVYADEYSLNGTYRNSEYKTYSTLVAFSSVSDKIVEIFATKPIDYKMFRGHQSNESPMQYTYIEINYDESLETKQIIGYELRLIDESYFNESYDEYYAKCFHFHDLSELQEDDN